MNLGDGHWLAAEFVRIPKILLTCLSAKLSKFLRVLDLHLGKLKLRITLA